MDSYTLLSFAIIASLLVMSPGPNGVLILKTVPASGRAAGFANIAGFVTAFYVHGLLSILGISVLLVQSANAFFVVKIIGAAYLCWLGFKALFEAWNGVSAEHNDKHKPRIRSLKKAYIEGFLTNALNPKVSMFYLAAFPQFISQANGAVSTSLTLVSIHAVINVIWFSAMVLLFARLAGAAKNKLFQRWVKSITGFVFIGFGAKLATSNP